MGLKIVGRPVGKNEEGKNLGALVIELRDPQGYKDPEEIARVAYERTEGHYKDTRYEDQVDIEIGKAVKTLEAVDELSKQLFENAGKLL